MLQRKNKFVCQNLDEPIPDPYLHWIEVPSPSSGSILLPSMAKWKNTILTLRSATTVVSVWVKSEKNLLVQDLQKPPNWFLNEEKQQAKRNSTTAPPASDSVATLWRTFLGQHWTLQLETQTMNCWSGQNKTLQNLLFPPLNAMQNLFRILTGPWPPRNNNLHVKKTSSVNAGHSYYRASGFWHPQVVRVMNFQNLPSFMIYSSR